MEPTYGIVITTDSGAEEVEEASCMDEALGWMERTLDERDEVTEVSLVELEGEGPVLSDDGDEIAPTHAPKATLKTMKRGE